MTQTLVKPTGQDGLALLDFPVEKAPVYLALGHEIPGHKAIIRPDTGKVLSIVTDQYKLVTYKQSFAPHLDLLGREGWDVHTVRLERDGARAFIELHNKTITKAVKRNDIVGLRLIIVNSYDASTGIRYDASYVVLWCLNGAVIVERIGGLKYRHAGDVFEQIAQGAGKLAFDFDKTIGLYRGLSDTPVSPEIAKAVIQEVCGQRKLDLVKHHFTSDGHLGSVEPNAWNLYNAITYYLTHEFGGQVAVREAKNREALDLLTHPEKVRQVIEAQAIEAAQRN